MYKKTNTPVLTDQEAILNQSCGAAAGGILGGAVLGGLVDLPEMAA